MPAVNPICQRDVSSSESCAEAVDDKRGIRKVSHNNFVVKRNRIIG